MVSTDALDQHLDPLDRPRERHGADRVAGAVDEARADLRALDASTVQSSTRWLAQVEGVSRWLWVTQRIGASNCVEGAVADVEAHHWGPNR